MDDDKFTALFGSDRTLNPFWSLLNVSVSEYLRRRTNLPIDFQVQRRSRVKDDDWAKRREPLGIYMPDWMPPPWAGGSA